MKKLSTKITLMLVLGLLAIGGTSAAIIGYLSNTAGSSVTVSSPISLMFTAPEAGDETTFGDVIAGGIIEYSTITTNNVGLDIDTYGIVYEITSLYEWSGEEFDSMMIASTDDGAFEGEVVDRLCHVGLDGSATPFADIDTLHTTTARLVVDNSGSNCEDIVIFVVEGSDSFTNDVEIFLNAAIAPDTYEFRFCYLHDLTGVCA